MFFFFFLVVGILPVPELCPSRGRHSAQRSGTVDSDAHITTGDEVRTPGVDVWVPAHELLDREGVFISGDDVPAGISLSDFVEQIAW